MITETIKIREQFILNKHGMEICADLRLNKAIKESAMLSSILVYINRK